MNTTQFTEMPQAIQYMPLPNGYADVWLRTNIRSDADADGTAVWLADEMYLRTELSLTEVQQQFDALVQKAKPLDEQVAALVEANNMLTECILEMSELLYGGD